ncbi:hypothetical protein EV127DRAFT_446038, partial [Xylaria flabelliformis]
MARLTYIIRRDKMMKPKIWSTPWLRALVGFSLGSGTLGFSIWDVLDAMPLHQSALHARPCYDGAWCYLDTAVLGCSRELVSGRGSDDPTNWGFI